MKNKKLIIGIAAGAAVLAGAAVVIAQRKRTRKKHELEVHEAKNILKANLTNCNAKLKKKLKAVTTELKKLLIPQKKELPTGLIKQMHIP